MKSYLLSILKLDRSVLVFIFAWAVIGLVHAGIISVLVNLYVIKIGFDFTFLGVMNGSSQIITALFAFPAAMIGSRFGLKNGVVLAYVVVVLGLLVFLCATWLPRPLWAAFLLIGNGMIGIAAALVVVNGFPYLMAITSEQDRSKAFTLQTALFTFCAFLGSLVAGVLPGLLMKMFPGSLNEALAFNLVLWLAVPAYIFTAFLMRTARSEPKRIIETQLQPRESAPVATLLFLGILFGVQISSESAVLSFVNVYFVENLKQSTAVVGSVFAVSQLLPFLTSPLQPLLLNRFGSGRLLAWGYLLVITCVGTMAMITTVTAAVILFVLFSLIISFTGTARNLFGQESVEARWRTASSAVLSLSSAAAGGLIGFGAGTILNAAGFRGLFLSSGALALLAILIYIVRLNRSNDKRVTVT